MSIHDELSAELREAIRDGDQRRKDVIRAVETEVSIARSEPGFEGKVDDDLYVRVIVAFVKKMEKARQEYDELGEPGRAHSEKLAYEIDYLARWLPEVLTDDEVRVLVRAAIAELAADDPKMVGRVTGYVMKSGTEGLDGAVVSRIVREELGAD